ncbi:hypothetical protein [Rhodohalobacter sp. 8-1]|uniref:hypothetical protein n=1 Tax=Rhodohalobacter sp. 8-1 TaxID=3131972 RepID=UPI0030EB6969
MIEYTITEQLRKLNRQILSSIQKYGKMNKAVREVRLFSKFISNVSYRTLMLYLLPFLGWEIQRQARDDALPGLLRVQFSNENNRTWLNTR